MALELVPYATDAQQEAELEKRIRLTPSQRMTDLLERVARENA